jgi:hypothetical protein
MTSWLVFQSAHEWLVLKRPMTASGLDRGQQERDQNGNDRNDHEQLDQREPSSLHGAPFVNDERG